jgi:hypothetical protein
MLLRILGFGCGRLVVPAIGYIINNTALDLRRQFHMYAGRSELA